MSGPQATEPRACLLFENTPLQSRLQLEPLAHRFCSRALTRCEAGAKAMKGRGTWLTGVTHCSTGSPHAHWRAVGGAICTDLSRRLPRRRRQLTQCRTMVPIVREQLRQLFYIGQVHSHLLRARACRSSRDRLSLPADMGTPSLSRLCRVCYSSLSEDHLPSPRSRGEVSGVSGCRIDA